MLCLVSVLLLFCYSAGGRDPLDTDEDLSITGGHLGPDRKVMNEAKVDLSRDEEYEDMRAELLAYRDVLSSLRRGEMRRSLLTTPCWRQGGICVHFELCPDAPFLTEIPGCKNRLHVCCLRYNQYRVRDMREHGISNIAMPWSENIEFGGEGVIDKEIVESTTEKRKKHKVKDKSSEKKGKEEKSKEEESKEGEFNEGEVKEEGLKEEEFKEDDVKDDEVKDDEVKDDEVKDDEVKDDEVQDEETKEKALAVIVTNK